MSEARGLGIRKDFHYVAMRVAFKRGWIVTRNGNCTDFNIEMVNIACDYAQMVLIPIALSILRVFRVIINHSLTDQSLNLLIHGRLLIDRESWFLERPALVI